MAMAGEADKAKSKPSCPKCGNRLRVLPYQIGTTVRCPKCNATFTLGQSRDRTEAASTAAASPDDAYEPEIPLTRSSIVPDEPSALLSPPAPPDVETDADAYEPEVQLTPSVIVPVETRAGSGSSADHRARSDADPTGEGALEMEAAHARPPSSEEIYLESARRRGMIRSLKMPDPPRWTFFSGVFTYPWRGINLSRWTAMSFGLSIAGVVSLKTLEYMGLMNGLLTNLALAGLLLALFATVMTLAVLSFSFASCQAAIQDTADGHDLPQEASLPEWDHWVFTFLAWLSLWAAAAAVGFPLSLAIGPIAFLISGTLLFPVLLLSAMESDSYIMPYSPPVLRTLGYYGHGWLTFYLLSTLMAAAWIAAFDAGYAQAPYLTVFLSGPVVAAMLLVYARLLGRLAWRASGAPAAPVEDEEEKPRADDAPVVSRGAKRSKRKKRSTVRIEIPDECLPGERPLEPPPRINFHLRP